MIRKLAETSLAAAGERPRRAGPLDPSALYEIPGAMLRINAHWAREMGYDVYRLRTAREAAGG